jgi:capsule polysaccharide export protein KpsE/RkpR
MKQSGGLEISIQPLQKPDLPLGSSDLRDNQAEGAAHRSVDRAWLLWENRLLIWRVTLSGLLLATILAFAIRNSYTSVARLMPPEKESDSSPMAMMAAMSGGGGSSGSGSGSSLGAVASDLLGAKSEGALVVEMLHGRTVADTLIERFDLCKVYGVKYLADARIRLADHTEIAEDKKSGIVVVKVRDHDPRRAAEMTQAYVEAVNDLLAAVSTSSARRERIFIEARLKTVKQALDKAEQQFSDYASKNTAIDIPEQGKAMFEAEAILQGQLIAAETELQGLSQIYTDSNVRVRSAAARVAELRKQLEKMGGDEASLNPDPKSKSGDPAPKEMYPSIRKLPLLGVEWANLYREARIEETVYEMLTGQYEMAKIQEAKEVPSVQAFDAGEVPERKSGPPRLLIMTVGDIFFFGAIVAWVLSSAAWQQVDPDDPRKQFADHVGRQTVVPLLQLATRVRQRARFLSRPVKGHPTSDVEDGETKKSK